MTLFNHTFLVHLHVRPNEERTTTTAHCSLIERKSLLQICLIVLASSNRALYISHGSAGRSHEVISTLQGLAMIIKSKILYAIIFSQLVFSYVAMGQSPKVLDAAELRLAVDKLSVLGSVLYVGAHPDDENTALLAYLAKGKLVRTAYLSMTRGEGGQNLVGPEQGDELGVIRTQELLAARRVDGAEQYFTRAIDFGFSKNSKETLEIWNKEKILSDVVWVIRKFRPDVIITRFSPTLGGHGNHTASAILAREAFNISDDSTRFPEQLKFVKPWKAKRIMFNTARFFDASIDTAVAIKVDVGEYSPLLGRSFTEIAGISRTNHKSQGFGSAQTRGPGVNYFKFTMGDPPKTDLFDGIDLSWSRVPGGEEVGKILKEVDSTFDCQKPSASLPLLLQAYSAMKKLPDDNWVVLKERELLQVIKECTGLWLDALASDYSVVPGSQVKVTVGAINRSNESMHLDSVSVPYSDGSMSGRNLSYNIPADTSVDVTIPEDFPYSNQYWLREPAEKGSYVISDQQLIGMPQNPPPLRATFYVTLRGQELTYNVPVQYRWVDPVQGELYRPFVAIPPVALNLEQRVFVFSGEKEKEISVTLKSGKPDVRGTVRLRLPQGWSSKPETISFAMKAKNEEKVVAFEVQASRLAESGSFSVEAEVQGKKLTQGMITIQYQYIPAEVMFPPAEGKLVRMDLSKNSGSVGYIMGAGDEIPTALRQMGYQVTLLTDDDLANRDLSPFDDIVAGVRAYNTRPALSIFQNRLMNYVKNGGTYIVQYVTPQRGKQEDLGPYPFEVSRDRVTVEESPVTFLNSNQPLLNYPNKITEKDFDGWIQERGIYFADKWDPRYETVLSCADPGESQKAGGMLYAKYGKGNYIYTGYVFFRELPAGVTGAYRLLSNMLNVGKRE
jgi:LmbE family N-acetylglucosaminyl deacetylase